MTNLVQPGKQSYFVIVNMSAGGQFVCEDVSDRPFKDWMQSVIAALDNPGKVTLWASDGLASVVTAGPGMVVTFMTQDKMEQAHRRMMQAQGQQGLIVTR